MKMDELQRTTWIVALAICFWLLLIFICIFRVSNTVTLLIIFNTGILGTFSAVSKSRVRFLLLAILCGIIAVVLIARHERSGLFVLSVVARFAFMGVLVVALTPRLTEISHKLYLDMEKLADERQEALQESRRWLSRLNALVQVITAIGMRGMKSGLDETFAECLQEARKVFNADSGLIYRIGRNTGEMSIISSFGYSEELLEKMRKKGVKKAELCDACKRMGPLIIDNLAIDEKCKSLASVKSGSSICVPIRTRNNLWGVLHLRRMHPQAFSKEDVQLAQAMAYQFAIAMQRAFLFEQISTLAVTDELTGLYNLRKLREDVEREVIRSKRYNHEFSIIMGDIDHFKKINDFYGHRAGDKVLKEIAAALESSKREVDRAYRYGGEEFVILLPETSLAEATEVAEKMRKRIESLEIRINENAQPLNVTISMGVSSFPENGQEIQSLIQAADEALYTAKFLGRNRVSSYSESLGVER